MLEGDFSQLFDFNSLKARALELGSQLDLSRLESHLKPILVKKCAFAVAKVLKSDTKTALEVLNLMNLELMAEIAKDPIENLDLDWIKSKVSSKTSLDFACLKSMQRKSAEA